MISLTVNVTHSRICPSAYPMTYSVMKISLHVKRGRLNIRAGESVLDDYLTGMFQLWFHCATFATETVG
jgi:hypothetical protein